MNYWTQLSVDYANQRNYLDDLFRIYPTIPEDIRDIDRTAWEEVEKHFNAKDNTNLLCTLLKFELFPLKDSYVAYLRRDPSAIVRNPETVNRLCGRLYELGLRDIFLKCSEPKETNRQIGPLFKRWLRKGMLGVDLLPLNDFVKTERNSILDGSDKELMDFAKKELNYSRDKGLDLVGRFNKKYVIGEAKFLTDFGGHQNAQFSDAIQTITTEGVRAIKVAILDGVLFIKSNNKMYDFISSNQKEYNIMSALVLREFLYQL
ncbi:MAG: restriction endonuclease [Candidatus Omnitrophica bacterium]|nr:restriction endonuclease [Candidatus Omnitrophota bacterium]